jgi:F-type H+-transporting ATPase subunit epsilon
MTRKLKCSILTPDRVLFEGPVDFAVVQAYDGEMGFLYNHAPLVAELGIGEIRLRNAEQANYLVIEGGFVEIKDNELIILAESATRKEELLKDEIERKFKELSVAEKPKTFKDKMLLSIELKKLTARLKVAAR